MDFHDRIKADEGALEKLMRGLPGFAGFMDQENRRDADKLLREHLCAELDGTVEALERVASGWSRAGQLDLLDDLERVAGRLRRAGDKLRFADYGYTGFFDAVKIDEDDLQRFYEYDLSLREFIGEVNEQVAALAEADEAEDALANLDEAIEALADMIGERERVAAELVP
jgi:phage tail tape-measure protein